MATLIDGRIPKGTECPFKTECPMNKNGICSHFGAKHTVDFSCASARAFEMIKEMRASSR